MSKINQKLEQRQKFNPRQILEANLMQLNIWSLEKRVVEELENNQTTAAGKGVAYPHSTSFEVKDLTCILGISKSGIDFNSPDGQLSHIILLSLSSNNEPDKHRKFITLFRSMIEDANVRSTILDADTPKQISIIINRWEEEYSSMDDLE